jgi:hypothetical protein
MPTIILASEDVHLEAEHQTDQVNLHWNAPEGYSIAEMYHSTDGRKWDLIAALPTQFKQPVQSVTDQNPVQGTNMYEVFLRDDNGNVKPSNRVQVYVENENAFSVYPNPAKDVISIRIPGFTENTWISLTDLTGKRILSIPATSAETTLQVESLSPGIYLVEANTGIKTYRQKVVVE